MSALIASVIISEFHAVEEDLVLSGFVGWMSGEKLSTALVNGLRDNRKWLVLQTFHVPLNGYKVANTLDFMLLF